MRNHRSEDGKLTVSSEILPAEESTRMSQSGDCLFSLQTNARLLPRVWGERTTAAGRPQPAPRIPCPLGSSSICLWWRPSSLRRSILGVWCGNSRESCSVWWWRHTGRILHGAGRDRDDNRSLPCPTSVPLPLLSHILGHGPGCHAGNYDSFGHGCSLSLTFYPTRQFSESTSVGPMSAFDS